MSRFTQGNLASRLKVLDGKSQPQLDTVRHFDNWRHSVQNNARARVTEWPTNEREDLALRSFIRTKTMRTWVLKTAVDLWQPGCIRSDAGRSFGRSSTRDFPMNNEQIIRRAYELSVQGAAQLGLRDVSTGLHIRGG